MFPADPLVQIYMITTVVGWGYILVSILVGQIGDHDGHCHDGAHHIHGPHDAHGHSPVHHVDGQTSGIGHLNHNPGATGALHTIGQHQHSSPHSPQHNGSHGGNSQTHSHHDGHHDGESKDTSNQPIVNTADSNTNIERLYFSLVSIFNPFTISYFVGFFGLSGSIVILFFPWLSWATLAPAAIGGIAGVKVVRAFTGLLAQKLSVSGTVSIDQSIGQLAEVSTPITDGRVGEITYKIGKNRFNAAAKPFDESKTFKRGSKVVIVQSEGPIMLVQAFDDED
jgi:membrane protein implicated in regulation of membrane protease activity